MIVIMSTPALSASVVETRYGVTPTGTAVDAFTLKNRHGMSVRILNYGGTITEINVPDRYGKISNIAVALRDLQDYEARPNFSSLIGRFANRISGGGFTLDGTRYNLPSNADGISSHGGTGGFGSKVWRAVPFKANGQAGVRLTYVSQDAENGYPGTLTTTVSFTLDEDNQLTLDYLARSDKPTVINLTHHVFFNLAGKGSITGHTLAIMASHYTPIDAKKRVTGDIAPVADTPFDLRQAKILGDGMAADHPQIALARGYDHNFVLDKTRPGDFSLAARLSDPVSGRVMVVTTTEPGIQLFTGGGFDGSLINAQGEPILKNYALALETQHFPDSPNQPLFPSTVLRPGELFHARTRYGFSVDATH
jgi:aldose 1-epimerase